MAAPVRRSCLLPSILSAWQAVFQLPLGWGGGQACPLGGGSPGGLVQFPRRKGCCLDHSILCLYQGPSNGNRRYESDEDSLGSSGRVMLPLKPLSWLCFCPSLTSLQPARAPHTSPKGRFCEGAHLPTGKYFLSACPGWDAGGAVGRIGEDQDSPTWRSGHGSHSSRVKATPEGMPCGAN